MPGQGGVDTYVMSETGSQAQVVGGQPEHHEVCVEDGGGLGSHHGGHAVPGQDGVDSCAQPGTACPVQVVEGQPEPHVVRVEDSVEGRGTSWWTCLVWTASKEQVIGGEPVYLWI